MTERFISICKDFGIDPTLPFNKIMEHIYYEWDQEILLNFMDELMYAETSLGDALFGD